MRAEKINKDGIKIIEIDNGFNTTITAELTFRCEGFLSREEFPSLTRDKTKQILEETLAKKVKIMVLMYCEREI